MSSTSEVDRVIKQGGFEVDGNLIQDPSAKLDLTKPKSYVVRLGKKKFYNVIVE
jgi:tyrosyl-tRNA synthetase